MLTRDGCWVAAVGCADPVMSTGMLLRRDGNVATVTCNTSGSGGGGEVVWTLRCVSGSWHGLTTSFNCSAGGSDGSSSRIRTNADQTSSWTATHFFPLDTFPYSQSPRSINQSINQSL